MTVTLQKLKMEIPQDVIDKAWRYVDAYNMGAQLAQRADAVLAAMMHEHPTIPLPAKEHVQDVLAVEYMNAHASDKAWRESIDRSARYQPNGHDASKR